MSDGKAQSRSFLLVFDNKLPKEKRIDILQDIREFPWWQETDFGRQAERLNHVRVILKDGAPYQKAMDDVNKIDGVYAEPVQYLETCSE